MPKLTPSELLQIHEIASEHATGIAKMSGYLTFAQDPHLETLLDHNRRKVETHYHELIDFATGETLDRRFENLDGGLSGGRSRATAGRPGKPVQPTVNPEFSDRTIAADCLNDAKHMAVRTVMAATEVSHAGLRRALSEMSRYHLDAAFEFYQYMEQKGWYVPLGTNENPERWFRQHHDQFLAGTQDMGRMASGAPS